MTFATAVLTVTLMAASAPLAEPEPGELVLRVCKIELTEAGRRARFSFHYLYALRTDPLGRVVAVERRIGREYPPFVREERFEPCLRSWRLRPASDYGVTIRVGTNVLENTITAERAGDPRLRLLVPI